MVAWNEVDTGPVLPEIRGLEAVACGATPSAIDIGVNSALATLERYDVLDTPREEAFDRITRLIRHILSVPVSTVAFLDGHRLWFKSRQGLTVAETERSTSFCQYPVAENRPLIVPDTLADPRFNQSPLVVDGPKFRFYAGAPLRASNGVCIGTLCALDTQPRALDRTQIDILLDLAHMAETELELRILATSDSLTGAASRRAFLEEGGRALSLAVRHRYDLSCVSFDIDHFKQINDTYGHAAGDDVLAATAKTCAAALRDSDIFGRLGGEEFSILLPHTDAAKAAEVAERLRAAVEKQATKSSQALQKVTASFGVATLSPGSTDLAALLAAADEAMYAAKSRGRNCCVVSATRAPELGRKVLKAGKIVFNLGHSVIDCTVRRLSENGAKLDVLSTDAIPRNFKLSIDADGFSKACGVVLKEDRSLEVAFDDLAA